MLRARRRTTYLTGFVTALGWLIWAHGTSSPGFAQQARTDGPAKPTPLYAGVSACRKCHTSSDQIKDAPPELCRCTEIPIWEKEDKHHFANAALDTDRSKEMGKLLGWNIMEDHRCLSCHAVVIKDSDLRKRSEEVGFSFKEGVTCTICHGPYLEWVGMHGDPLRRPTWRKLSRSEKETLHGMTDLWDPQKRARLCTSCHIGNTSEGKFVTHAMYAAGHPPLPSFELAAFSEEMPRHWQYLREKKPNIQELLKFNKDEARWEQTKLVAVGNVVALQASLDLLAREAQRCAQAEDPQKRVLDFALFDCAACHHELRKDGWRSKRGYIGSPGRPNISAWPSDIARLGLVDSKGTGLDTGLQKLSAALGARPYGDPGQVAAEAEELVRQIDPIMKRLSAQRYDEVSAKNWLSLLTHFKETDYPDYDTARQRAWAFAVLWDELDWKPETDPRKSYQKQIKSIDQRLKGLLTLELPSGQNKDILAELPNALKKKADYEPRTFVERFQTLRPK